MLGELFQKVLDMSLIGCYSILIVMAVRLLLSRCERKFTYYLWFVVFLNLCIPFSFQGVFSLIPDFVAEFSVSDAVEDVLGTHGQDGPDAVIIPTMPDGIQGIDSNYNFALGNPGGADYLPQALVEETTPLIIKIASGVWLAGIAVLLMWSLAGMLRLKKQISRDNWIRFNRKQKIAEVADLDTPFLWGIFNPMIYLPADLEPEEMRYIVAHEQYHRKRKDYLIKIAVFFVVAIHWFNPLVWAAYTLFCRDMEISCDEAVLLEFKENIRKQYAGSLLKYAARQSGFVLSPITFGEPAVKNRIKNVLRFRKRGIVISVLTVICVVSVAAGLVLRPSAEEGMSPNSASSSVAENQNDLGKNNPPKNAAQLSELSEGDEELPKQDAELINMAIYDNEHNIYTGNIGNEEIRMLITRTGDRLSAAYITRDRGEKAFQGDLKSDSSGFILNTDSGDYLEGIITADDNGGINISGEGVISERDVVFTLNQNTFFPMGEDSENYYSSLGYAAEEAEQFVEQIKDSINDKTTFAELIQYPVSIDINGSLIMIEDEESMIDTYDHLMESGGFKRQIENIYTKYMFANYMGICVEDGIMWINTDPSGDYKITAINPPSTDIVLNDEQKSLLQTMCYYMPDFSGVTLMEDERFWRNFIYSSFTNVPVEYGKSKPIYGEGEYVMVYREDWGYEEPAFKISEKYVQEYVRLFLGVEMPEFKPAFEDIKENQSVYYYQDGYYYIGGSDFGEAEYRFRDMEVSREQYDTSALVRYDILLHNVDTGEQEVEGTVQFHLKYAGNANGFVIIGKEVEWD